MDRPGICCIVGALPLEEALFPSPQPGDLLIAADGGYAALAERGVIPDLVVGDFDSLGAAPRHPQVLRLPSIKDETDMGCAIGQGLERGYTRFLLLGGLGGRLEHTVANLQLLSGLSRRGALGVLAGGGQAAAAVTGRSLAFPETMQGFCSVFCQGGTARGVTLEGLKYPLEGEELTGCFPLGVSNEFLDRPARIRAEEGTLLVIWGDQVRLPALRELLERQ